MRSLTPTAPTHRTRTPQRTRASAVAAAVVLVLGASAHPAQAAGARAIGPTKPTPSSSPASANPGIVTKDPSAAQRSAAQRAAAAAAAQGVADRPYLGWSSWSMESSNYPGLNPGGGGSSLNEVNVLKQTDAMAAKLKQYGYQYINMDAG